MAVVVVVVVVVVVHWPAIQCRRAFNGWQCGRVVPAVLRGASPCSATRHSCMPSPCCARLHTLPIRAANPDHAIALGH